VLFLFGVYRRKDPEKKTRRRHGDFRSFILLALLKKGPLSLESLKELTSIMATQFEIIGMEFSTRIFSRVFSRLGRPAAVRSSKPKDGIEEPDVIVTLECENLLATGSIAVNETGEYRLTEKGKEEAESFSKKLEKGTQFFEKQLLGSTAAARNTVIVGLFLAVIKLTSGFLGGSIGLISDGADASIDTVSAFVSWVGMRLKRESLGALVTIFMMFVAGVSVGYESVTTVIEALRSKIVPIALPYLVIGVEGVALILAAFLFFYQRFTGKRNGSLVLISQSVDSKNHIYIATMVIAGAIFSILGIRLVDALVGTFVAARIVIDATGLSKEMLASMKGKPMDLTKYEMPLEKKWQQSKLETFRSWILYSTREEGINTKAEIIHSLEKTFDPAYVPILSEFRFSLGRGFNFSKSFDILMEPLLNEGLLIQKDEGYIITNEGKNRISRLVKNTRFSRIA
jgi:divalent metal cation (Fe/Co/Zn/Cd) transporter